MSRIEHAGMSVTLPAGWEAATIGGGFDLLPDGARQPTILQLSSFPLPARPDSFGADAVTRMRSDDVFIVLFEYGPEAAGGSPFTSMGIPRPLQAREFDRSALQRGIAGQSGLQRFFTESGRAFCLYVVIGSHIDRVDLAARANAVLETLEIR